MKQTPMQEFIRAITENGLISINQTLIDGALREEKQVIEDAWYSGAVDTNAYMDLAEDYYNETFKQK